MHHLTLSFELMLYGLVIVFGVLLLFYGSIALLNALFPFKEDEE
jgi:hypothetical protein